MSLSRILTDLHGNESYQKVSAAKGDGHQGVGEIVPVDDQFGASQQAHEPAQQQRGDSRRYLQAGGNLFAFVRLLFGSFRRNI